MKKKRPALRFSGFDNDWEQRKLGDVSDSYSGGTPTADVSEYYGGQIPFIRSAEINSVITELFLTEGGLKNSSARLVEMGDILYALYGATSGEVGRARLTGAINQAILAIKPHGGYDSEYIAQWLRKSKHSIIETYLQGGQGNLSGAIVKELSVDFPTLKEQQVIGVFFKQLDHLITLHRCECKKLICIKKSMLENMFPQKGEKIPRIRFSGFTDDWEQRKLGEVLQTLPFENFIKTPEQDGEYEIIQQGNEPILGFAKGMPCTDYRDVVIFGDHTMSLYKPHQPFFIATDGVRIIKGKQKMDGFYLMAMLERYRPQSEGYKRYYSILTNTECFFTENWTEQQQIGIYFRQLDHLITLHQRKLEKLQNIKKAMLEKMFV